MGIDGRDRKWTTDRDGKNWMKDSDGKPVYDGRGNRVPGPATKVTDPVSNFTTYDTSQGHCGLCGRLTCNGGCFK